MNRTPIESFLDLTRKSGLVDANRLNLYLEKLNQKESIPDDPKELAKILVRDAVLSRFQADQLLSNKWRGFYVGKYRVIERIGIGGMGQVYLAEHRTMKRRYAIKVLPRSKASDPAALERFEREARAGGSIDHPNIVRAYDKDQDGDLHYLVMDFVDGCSLAEIVQATGPLDVARAGHYMYQSALGLKHAHDSGLIHRDIKPANILIDREGVVKILDMGLARFFNDHDDMITKKYDETVLGTADYLSPEQAIDSHNVDIRSDIYSLGCTFYYTLTGQPPFGEGSVAQKLIWHQTRSPKALTEHRADIPAELSNIINRCMMKNVDDRFKSPEALLEALQPYQHGVYPPSSKELADLSPMARGVPFGGDILSGIGGGSVAPEQPGSKDPDSKSPIFDSQLVQRGGEDSTVNIRSGDSGFNHPTLPTPVSPAMQPVAPAPTVPVMVMSAKAAGIAPRPHSSPPIIIEKQPPSPLLPAKPTAKTSARNQWDPYSTPLPFPSPLGEKAVSVLPAKEGPSSSNDGRKSLPLWVWLTIALVLTLVMFALLYFVVLRDKKTGTSSPTKSPVTSVAATSPSGPRTWHVAKVKIDGIDFTSIKEAIEQAGPGDTIRITDQQNYVESLQLNPRTIKNGFGRIAIVAEVGEDGKRARLMPPPSHPASQPLLVVDSVDSLVIKGFLLDGADGVQTVLEAKGNCPGLQLEDIRFEGFQQQGILAENLSGNVRREIYFDKLYIRHNGNDPAAAGIRIQGAGCNSVQLRGCRIQGKYTAAIVIGAPTQRFQMEQCKVYGGKGKAIVVADTIAPNSKLNATIQQCTFWDFEQAVSIETPMNANDIYFTLRNNLFYQVKNVLHVDEKKAKIKPESLGGGFAGQGNVFDTASSQAGHALQIPKFGLKGLTFTLNTSPTPAQEFLRYPAGSPPSTAGERKDPVGATE